MAILWICLFMQLSVSARQEKSKEIEGKLCKIKQRKAKKHSTATNENRTP